MSKNQASGVHAKIPVGCRVGDGCEIFSNVILYAGVEVGARTRIGPNVVFVESDDPAMPGTKVGEDARIGANSSIYPGLTIGAKAEIRPGTVVTRSVPPKAIVEGNPAVLVGYVETELSPRDPVAVLASPSRSGAAVQTAVRGVTVHTFPVIPDLRGSLTAGEFDRQIPFTPLRYFMVFGVPSREIRGEHAHRECHQFLICVRGSCAIVADDGHKRMEIVLDEPNRGLYLPPMTWGIQYKYSPDALLLVFASHYYDAADYIRDYGEFLKMVSRK